MAINSKLEFFRFELNPKNDGYKTFKDFAIDEIGASKKISNSKVTEELFKHFMSSLEGDYSKDKFLKKQIALVPKKSVNRHLDKRPTFNSKKFTIQGVINGGLYGRDRILSNISDIKKSSVLGIDKSVLQYFYFLLYVPSDHNEGCLIVHSNSADESITILMRRFVANIFRKGRYKKPIFQPFCPKSFQDEFKEGAVLKSMIFKNTFVDSVHTTDAISKSMAQYDIKITATPKVKTISMASARQFRNRIAKKLFGDDKKATELNDFSQAKVIAENPLSKKTKIFEWNARDSAFVPVVYLRNRVSIYDDGTPNLAELSNLCITYLDDEILPELRPDKDVVKA